MDKRKLIIGGVIIFIIGIVIGFLIDFPNKFEIVFTVAEDTQDWYDDVWEDLNSTQWKNMCCYPSDCSQARNNPEVCTCVYMVECLSEEEINESGIEIYDNNAFYINIDRVIGNDTRRD